MTSERIVLVDVDGVLLNWIVSFERWMRSQNYKKKNHSMYRIEDVYGITSSNAHKEIVSFNNSKYIGLLPAFRDARKYVRKLHTEHGYVFHCVTAIPDSNHIKKMRRQNIEGIFGSSAIKKIDCVTKSANKEAILAQYAGSGAPWVEDLYSNVLMGRKVGLTPYIMDHWYNRQSEEEKDIVRVKNWANMYERIVSTHK